MFGQLTAPAIGIILKEMVRRAMQEIRKQRLSFEVTPKAGLDGRPDIVTSADQAAQAIYIKLIRECLPGVGAIGEENGLRLECTLEGIDAFIVIDPLDGTRAFGRGQAFGVATQIALVVNGEVVAVFIGDVITGDIFGYRPESPKVHHITNLETSRNLLEVDHTELLVNRVALLRAMPEELHPLLQRIIRPAFLGGAVKQYEIGSGSLTLTMARLWSGQVGICALPPYPVTPWDIIPVIGMCQRLDMVFMRPSHNESVLEQYSPRVSKEVYECNHDTLVVHKSRLPDLAAFTSPSG